MSLKRITESVKENDLKQVIAKTISAGYDKGDSKIYIKSIVKLNDETYLIARVQNKKSLVIFSDRELSSGKEFEGELFKEDINVKICPLNHNNAVLLRKKFPYTMPVPMNDRRVTFGLGDRLGIATPGHIRVCEEYDVGPVFAQQSIRELTLTNRTFDSVLDDVSWAVFQEGYKSGFGADGDHLKTEEDILLALKAGFTMITIDLSDYINSEAYGLGKQELGSKYNELFSSKKEAEELKERYVNKKQSFDEVDISFTEEELERVALTFIEGIRFTEKAFQFIKGHKPGSFDFEVSIDETGIPTKPEEHFFVINELNRNGVRVTSLAPRFVGEFQKGIDYIGNVDEFSQQFKKHVAVAENNGGYKISVHSGSDKFSVFPIVGELTGGLFHQKTAGTNWLEAIRVVARLNPKLYREIHAYALEKFKEATKYYHVTTDLNRIKPLKDVEDKDLPEYLEKDESRQLLHITYGFILTAEENNKYLFRDRFFQMLEEHEDDYCEGLEKHIGRHMDLLRIKKLDSKKDA